MISFQQLCELLTNNKRYSWFYFSTQLLNHLTEEEKSLVHIQQLEDDVVRLFYPPEKYIIKQLPINHYVSLEPQLSITELEQKLKQAYYDDNKKAIKQIKKQIKEYFTKT